MSLSGYAVDLGGTKIAVARIVDGAVTERLQQQTKADADLAGQLDTIEALLAEIGYRAGSPLGVAVAGRIDRDGNWHAVNTATLSAITAAPLGQALKTRFGHLAKPINDAAAAALAEAKIGVGQGAYNFAYITVSTGVGGGLVLGGRLIDSLNGLSGHVGFSSSRFSDARCGSGRQSAVESIASGKAIARLAQKPDARTVFVENPEHPAIDTSARAVATLIADLTAILGLDRVAIGGSVGLATGYFDRVKNWLESEPALFRPSIVKAKFGDDSGLIGALLYTAQEF